MLRAAATMVVGIMQSNCVRDDVDGNSSDAQLIRILARVSFLESITPHEIHH